MSVRRLLLVPSSLLLLGLGLALLLAVAWMGAPERDVVDLLRYLLISGLISLGLTLAGLLWLRAGRGRIWIQVLLTCTLGISIALFNIFLTSRLMFISADHDLPLLVLLLMFAGLVSFGLGFAVADTLAGRLAVLHQGAQRVARGELSTRVPVHGSDELAELAVEFNRMAQMLDTAAAERSQLEAARRDLIAAVSHDLRTPLASLRALVEALHDGLVEEPATRTRYLSTMRMQISHLNGLIDDLFELAQIDAGALKLSLQRVNPLELFADVIEAARPRAAEREISIECDLPPHTLPLLVAPQKIERVLYNLIDNALRHTPSGGRIRLCLAPLEPASSQHRAALVEVADTGSGIAAEDLPHIFERFYRGEKSRSRATGGAGLGLAIARGIVEAHGGQIWAESSTGQGTRIRFTLPVAE